MRILTRYLLRAHAGPFVFALTVLTTLLLVNTVAQRFEELAGKGLPASVIAEVFILSVPYTLALTLPMAVLVAVLHAFSQLTADNEITAMKASGVNLARLLVPMLVAASLLAGGMVYFHDRILPAANHRLAGLLTDIARKSPTLELKEQVINPIETGDLRTRYYLQAARIEPATNRLWDVVIYDLSKADRNRTIYADSGRMAFNRERTDLFLTLYDGLINEIAVRERETLQRLAFRRQLIRIEGVGDRLERGDRSQRGDREMSLGQLRDAAADRRARLDQLHDEASAAAVDAVERALNAGGDPAVPRPDGMAEGPSGRTIRIATADAPAVRHDPLTTSTADELRTLASRARSLRHRMNTYEVEYHKKFSIPFACIVFVLIGAPLGVRFPRGGIGMVIAASLGIFAVYYMGLIGGEELADEGIVAPFWAMWAPNVLFLGFGIWGVVRIGYETSTARGGGWDDLWRTVRRLATRPLGIFARRGS